MSELIAYCGLNCSGCPIYVTTFETDKSKQQQMRINIAKQCTELYGMDMKPEDVNDCDGCIANTGRIFSGCMNCKIRECAMQKDFKSCAWCPEYACEKLEEMFTHDQDAKVRLELMRNLARI